MEERETSRPLKLRFALVQFASRPFHFRISKRVPSVNNLTLNSKRTFPPTATLISPRLHLLPTDREGTLGSKLPTSIICDINTSSLVYLARLTQRCRDPLKPHWPYIMGLCVRHMLVILDLYSLLTIHRATSVLRSSPSSCLPCLSSREPVATITFSSISCSPASAGHRASFTPGTSSFIAPMTNELQT